MDLTLLFINFKDIKDKIIKRNQYSQLKSIFKEFFYKVNEIYNS